MIYCKATNKEYANKQLMFDDLREFKNILIAEKKAQLKHADAVLYAVLNSDKIVSEKATYTESEIANINELQLKLVINTTNIMDSHSDVHIPGLWNKSLNENKTFLLLQEHSMKFEKVISDKAKASVMNVKWSDLGQKYAGTTQALIFDVTISKSRNEFMFNQYAKGYVTNHSVGMRYVKLGLALNSDSKYDVAEKELWDKYIDEVANKDEAEAQGYFWVVKEAKIIEGSAVVKGSNQATPTISVESKAVNNDTLNIEPLQNTQTKKNKLSINHFLN